MKNKITNKITKVITVSIILSSVFSSFPLGVMNTAQAALQAAGPISSVHGFPAYYQDSTGLALQPCLGVNTDGTGLADPNCVLPLAGEEINFNPAQSVSFPDNFPSEHFYWIGDAGPVNVGTAGAKAKFRMVLESAFGSITGAPETGQQIVFLRINFAVNKVGGTNGLTPLSTYTINHPFGSFTVNTDAAGDIIGGGGAEFRAEDGAFTPPLTNITAGSFLSAPTTGIGPFLRAVNPAPPAGYIGNPNVLQTIQAGPNGATFSISGPNVDGLGGNNVVVDQWALAGKIAVIDTVAPTIVSSAPASVPAGSSNVALSVNITDNLGVTSVTADLGSLGNSLSATLNGAQEIPTTASGATGSGNFTIDTAANTLSFNITVSGLQGGPETAAHIHGPALAGANAPAVFNLPQGVSKVGTWNYPENLEADILSGKMYVQIHTALFAAGEIRGQILPTPNVQNLILTAGTRTNGTWGVLIPSVSRPGLFTIPITATDGSNPATVNHSLAATVLTSIAVTPASASAVVGTTQQFTAQGLDQFGNPMDPQPAITWTSSNNGVASINAAGLASGVTVGGPITITAVSGAISGTASLTVINPPSILTSISLTPAVSTIQAAGTRQLTAQGLDQFGLAISPQPAITWTSSNNAVATVSATGLVTGVSLGSAVITATSGTTAATANITVSSAPACQTGADTNADGFISNIEILNYVRGWKAGTVSNLLILRAINFWKSGTGC